MDALNILNKNDPIWNILLIEIIIFLNNKISKMLTLDDTDQTMLKEKRRNGGVSLLIYSKKVQ